MRPASTELPFQIPVLIADHQLAAAIRDLRMYMEDHPSEGAVDAINAIENDYQLMLSYARQGYQDPSREILYKHLQQRLLRLCLSLQVRHWIEKLPFFRNGMRSQGRCIVSIRSFSLAFSTVWWWITPGVRRISSSMRNCSCHQLSTDLMCC